MQVDITLACLALHNYLFLTDNTTYCPDGFMASYNLSGNIKDGEWRSEVNGDNSTVIIQLRLLCGSRHRRCSCIAKWICELFQQTRDVLWRWIISVIPLSPRCGLTKLETIFLSYVAWDSYSWKFTQA